MFKQHFTIVANDYVYYGKICTSVILSSALVVQCLHVTINDLDFRTL